MKKKIIILGVIILIFSTASLILIRFQGNRNQEEVLEDSFSTGMVEYQKDGILYYTGNYIRYADNASGKDGLICVDQSCEHNGKRNSQCGAVISAAAVAGMVRRGDQIYYIADDNVTIGRSYLYSCDLTGRNRKKVGKLCDMDYIQDVIYRGSKIYIQYAYTVYENEKKNNFGVYCYDLETKTGDYIYRKTGTVGALDGMVIGDNVLYYSFIYSDVSDEELLEHATDKKYISRHRVSRIMGMDLETGKQTMEIEGYGSNCVLPYVDGKLFYAKGSAMYRYDSKENTSTKICDEELVSKYSVGFEDKVFFGKYDPETSQTRYYYYDTTTEKLQTIGKGEKNILAVFPDTVYLGQDQEEGKSPYARASTKEFLEGRLDEVTGYKSLWQEE